MGLPCRSAGPPRTGLHAASNCILFHLTQRPSRVGNATGYKGCIQVLSLRPLCSDAMPRHEGPTDTQEEVRRFGTYLINKRTSRIGGDQFGILDALHEAFRL